MTSLFSALNGSPPGGSSGAIQFNNGGVLGGATKLIYDDDNGILSFADETYAAFGVGGLTGALGCDGRIFSNGTETCVQIESDTGGLGQTNPTFKIKPYSLFPAPSSFYVPILDASGAPSFAGYLGMSPALYVQDISGNNDSIIFIPVKDYPNSGTDYGFITLNTNGGNPFFSISDAFASSGWIDISSTGQGVSIGLGSTSPDESFEINANTRLRDTNALRFGGSGASDFRVEAFWDDPTLTIRGQNSTNNEEMKINFEDTADNIELSATNASFLFSSRVRANAFLNIGTTQSVTISSGAVTATKSRLSVDTQSAAATDDLDTINGTQDGDILIIQNAASGRTVVVTDGVGNIKLQAARTLSHPDDKLVLLSDGTNLYEISYANVS